MVPRLVVPRREINEVKEIKGWVLIYGRRKTGKTFLVRNFLKYDEYYFVSRGGEIFYYKDSLQEIVEYNVFFDRMKRNIVEDKVIVIDEFQRLPTEFFDFLHSAKTIAKVKLILISSSMRYVREFLGKKGPLLGIVTPYKLSVFEPIDILSKVAEIAEPKEALKISSIAKDPIVLEWIDLEDNFENNLVRVLKGIRTVVPALIGEIFVEEERELTERYELVLKAVAAGKRTPADVAKFVASITKKPLKSQDVKKYMRNLLEMGLLKRYPYWKTKKFAYFMESPIVDLYYFLDYKLGISEIDWPERKLLKVAMEKVPFYYEDFVVSLLADIYEAQIFKKEANEIDGILSNEEKMAVEVKFGRVGLPDIIRFREKTRDFEGKKVIVADNEFKKERDIEFLTPRKLVELALEAKKKREKARF